MYYEGKEFEATITNACAGEGLAHGAPARAPAALVLAREQGWSARRATGTVANHHCSSPVGWKGWQAGFAAALKAVGSALPCVARTPVTWPPIPPCPNCAGVLSPELQAALGMSEGSPPPWLINMQVRAASAQGPSCTTAKRRIRALSCAKHLCLGTGCLSTRRALHLSCPQLHLRAASPKLCTPLPCRPAAAVRAPAQLPLPQDPGPERPHSPWRTVWVPPRCGATPGPRPTTPCFPLAQGCAWLPAAPSVLGATPAHHAAACPRPRLQAAGASRRLTSLGGPSTATCLVWRRRRRTRMSRWAGGPPVMAAGTRGFGASAGCRPLCPGACLAGCPLLLTTPLLIPPSVGCGQGGAVGRAGERR